MAKEKVIIDLCISDEEEDISGDENNYEGTEEEETSSR